MVKVSRTFVAGKMNKVVDERLLPPGEYVDALNLRLGSTEQSEIGSIELSTGNELISNIQFNGTAPSAGARCIGALADNANEIIYWFINDPTWAGQGGGSPVTTTILDMVVAFNTRTSATNYHLISVQEGGAATSTLNFDHTYLITGVNLVDDLLFWTDNLNPPRCINITHGYLAPTIAAGVVTSTDNFSAEDIRVIVRPPLNAPTVNTSTGPDEFNFLTERFISFAYRYRYSSGEYSATSQFSDAAFVPESFQFSPQSFLNEGMTNRHNVANITFNTGNELVKSIELLWKDNDNGIIKVMERIKKEGLYANNVDVSRSFNTNKILTVLPNSEILRLYDNVPRFAKAQTLMGNRLVYGNYVENYDLKSEEGTGGVPTDISYTTTLVNNPISNYDLPTSTSAGLYTIWAYSNTVPDTILTLDFSSVATSLTSGSVLTIDITFQVGYVNNTDYYDLSTVGAPTNPPPETSVVPGGSVPEQFTVTMDYVLPATFTGLDNLITNPNFLAQVGDASTILPLVSACSGFTWTDMYNCNVPVGYMTDFTPITNPPYNLWPVAFGIDVQGGGIEVASVGTNLVLQFPSIRYCQTPGDTTDDALSYNMYFSILSSSASFSTGGAPTSLHSNRGYEVGIVYMDAFKRATTAFTSPTNVVHVGCGESGKRNQIQVGIPTSQVAPWWATTYKFVIKPSATTYETIFANLVFQAPGSVDAYILLEGENARKVEEGTRLIVKADMSGPLDECNYVTVLEKKTQTEPWLTVLVDPADASSGEISVPSGVYMKIKASGVDLTVPPDSIMTTGWESDTATSAGDFPVIKLGPTAFNQDDGTPIPIPSGSRIRFKFKFTRNGPWSVSPWGWGEGACERRKYKYEPDDFYSGNDYGSIIEWFDTENIKALIELNDGESEVLGSGCPIDNNVFEPIQPPTSDINALDSGGNLCVNEWRWYQDPGTQDIRLLVRGTRACAGGSNADSKVGGEITIFRATALLIFETEPTEGLPDIWYEGQDNYGISDGDHLSGTEAVDVDQDIVAGTAGVVLLGNHNCYTFGNGCESYTIRDSVKGRSFSLGNRVTATASQDYGRIRRYADLTYSGVYNDESNVNKLNEFNLGLLNFKPLEDSFGSVQKLVGRKSDILVLQEDKISYVLSGKNLLSDSTGGGAVTATPLVLGTQIARLEDYGVSRNPESYAEFGYDKFFTDEKRGAVIQLRGGGAQSESLSVISEAGMRSWFRDLFNDETNDIKLGGFDPYMNEYVLNSSDIQLPIIAPCLNCGLTQSYVPVGPTFFINFCVSLGTGVGDVTITTDSAVALIQATYDGVVYAGVVISSLTFPKTSQTPTEVVIDINNAIPFTITVGCPVPIPLEIKRIVINSPQYSLPEQQTVHNQNRWVDGSFNSTVQPPNDSPSTYLLSMADSLTGDGMSFVTSLCDFETGFQGVGAFPTDTSNLTVMSTQVLATDTFVFNPTYHRLGYFRSTNLVTLDCTVYADVETILAATTFPALNAQEINPDTIIDSVTGAMPAPTGAVTDILYLVYDYRVVTEANLCYVADSGDSPVDIIEVCCTCSCASGNTTYTLYTSVSQDDGNYIMFNYLNASSVLVSSALIPGVSQTVCVLAPNAPVILSAGYESYVDISIDACGCT